VDGNVGDRLVKAWQWLSDIWGRAVFSLQQWHHFWDKKKTFIVQELLLETGCYKAGSCGGDTTPWERNHFKKCVVHFILWFGGV